MTNAQSHHTPTNVSLTKLILSRSTASEHEDIDQKIHDNVTKVLKEGPVHGREGTQEIVSHPEFKKTLSAFIKNQSILATYQNVGSPFVFTFTHHETCPYLIIKLGIMLSETDSVTFALGGVDVSDFSLGVVTPVIIDV